MGTSDLTPVKGRDPQKTSPERRALLSMVHIARKEILCDDELLYRDCVRSISNGRTDSAKDLSMSELRKLRDHFVGLGWRPRYRRSHKERTLMALQAEAGKIVEDLDMHPRSLRGLCRKFLGTESISWCRDPDRLKRLLAVLANIRRRELEG